MIGCQTRDGTRLEGKSSNQLKRSGQMEERSTELLWWGREAQASLLGEWLQRLLPSTRQIVGIEYVVSPIGPAHDLQSLMAV